MRINRARSGQSIMIVALAALTCAAVASAAGITTPACKAHSKTKKACFPKKIAGTFSGENSCYSWKGKLSTRRHKEQTTYVYEGTGSFDWTYKPDCSPGCTQTPMTGTVTIKPAIVINRTRNPGIGWYYTGDDFQKRPVIEGLTRDCGNGPESNQTESLVAVFAAGGQSKRLKVFKGTQNLGTLYKWSLTGSN